ncbi:MAG: hypothetical protein K8F30_11550 [Taibaiella sp.]|nr:hypothetical protein [Taibaiella sp.]
MAEEVSYCDCTKVPFPEECVEYCIERILRVATPEEKQLVLGFSPSLAHNIKFKYLINMLAVNGMRVW